ncbi:hypothetical protein [Sorangium cellulosum]|uniref:hypothetical protein n=1 Tax=Sorangium cellulosum TaxID=56 RepID=UPI00101067CF|nr:hypothetical protein [Sorangium cellulosum]
MLVHDHLRGPRRVVRVVVVHDPEGANGPRVEHPLAHREDDRKPQIAAQVSISKQRVRREAARKIPHVRRGEPGEQLAAQPLEDALGAEAGIRDAPRGADRPVDDRAAQRVGQRGLRREAQRPEAMLELLPGERERHAEDEVCARGVAGVERGAHGNRHEGLLGLAT